MQSAGLLVVEPPSLESLIASAAALSLRDEEFEDPGAQEICRKAAVVKIETVKIVFTAYPPWDLANLRKTLQTGREQFVSHRCGRMDGRKFFKIRQHFGLFDWTKALATIIYPEQSEAY